jgi:hypothetical protein
LPGQVKQNDVPLVSAKVPAEHSEHMAEPAVLKRPAEQRVQFVDNAWLNEPDKHGSQVVAPVELEFVCDPAWHAMQSPVIETGAKRPTWHSVHLLFAVKVPAAQSTQNVASIEDILPAKQGPQADAPI